MNFVNSKHFENSRIPDNSEMNMGRLYMHTPRSEVKEEGGGGSLKLTLILTNANESL
jgi:hypothetical protein